VPATAIADVRDRLSRFIGTASFREEQGGVRVTAVLRNLPPGPHGLHIANLGYCLSPEFLSAGEIFNPTARQHGLRNPAGPQVGDLPSLLVGADGSANLDAVAQGATLSSGPAALLGGRGTALILHRGDDDQLTNPDGNAGDRIACGVILPSDPVAASATAQSRAPVPAAAPVQPAVVPGGAAAAAQPVPAAQRANNDQSTIIGAPLFAGGLGVLIIAIGYFLRRQARHR
jgi:Cu-Zn family superoxide dismutase